MRDIITDFINQYDRDWSDRFLVTDHLSGPELAFLHGFGLYITNIELHPTSRDFVIKFDRV